MLAPKDLITAKVSMTMLVQPKSTQSALLKLKLLRSTPIVLRESRET